MTQSKRSWLKFQTDPVRGDRYRGRGNSYTLHGTDGNFYGTTSEGGAYGNGTVFRITPAGNFTTLYNFCSQADCTDGSQPVAALVQGIDGNLYGTTHSGGAYGWGSVFKITPAGTLTTLHSFDVTDGAFTWSGLLQGTNGIFYGTTYGGGSADGGTVFSLDMGLGPFVSFVQRFGKVGRQFQILGQGFTGTTSVSFNGTAAAFTVEHDTFLVGTVSAGATTGYVTVTTPSGTLTSNVPFNVIP